MGLRPGGEGVRRESALRLVPQEPQGRRHRVQHLPRRTENLYHGQLRDAGLCRAGRAAADGEGDSAQNGRAVPQYEDALHRRRPGGARAHHAPRHPLFGPLPRDEKRRGEREADTGVVRQGLSHEGLHLQGRARHADDPARLDSPPQANHACLDGGARPPHGLCKGLCRRT